MGHVSIVYGIKLSIMSMLIVFVLLYFISLILESFKILFKENKSKEKNISKKIEKQKKEVKVEKIINDKGITFEEIEKDKDMLIAAMVASIEASGEKKESNYKIVSIKKL